MKSIAKILVLLVVVQTLNVPAALGDRSDLTFPLSNASLSVLSGNAGFAFGDQVGFNLVLTPSPYKFRLFSFSVLQARLVDELDLEADFGASQSLASTP